MELKETDLKVASSKREAHWVRLLESLEQEQLNLETQLEINRVIISHTKAKVKALKGK